VSLVSRVGDGIGDDCWNDNDNDTVINPYDNCPDDSLIWSTDFRQYTTINLDPIGDSQLDPLWKIHHQGQEIQQIYNSDPGVAIGGFDNNKKRKVIWACFKINLII